MTTEVYKTYLPMRCSFGRAIFEQPHNQLGNDCAMLLERCC